MSSQLPKQTDSNSDQPPLTLAQIRAGLVSPLSQADASTDQDCRDQTLGEEVDCYIDSIHGATNLSPAAPATDPEVGILRQVARKLHALDCYLASTETNPSPDTLTHPGYAPSGRPKGDLRWQTLSQIGKYEIREVLGAGGQAVTYKAWDPDLSRQVVIKLYHAAQAPGEKERVLKEGQALARVHSPYVASCYSAEYHDGVPYLVIEYIPGRSLGELQRVRPPDEAGALELTARVAEGLAAVHGCGLLHRDVKPANILIGDDGVPRLIDFGLAKPIGDAALDEVSGTLAYMAPEQARGDSDRIDPRTDLFGLGAVLYHLLTGSPPFAGKTTEELWKAARAGDVVPARARNPRLSRQAAELCMRCLARDPAGRFASAYDLVQAIQRYRRLRRTQFAVLGGLAAALLILIVGGLALRSFFHQDREPLPGLVQIPPAEEQPRDPDGKLMRNDFPLQVELKGARQDPARDLYRMTDGQLLFFRIDVPQKCYLGIWYRSADGEVTQLFPNDYEPDHLVPAGKQRLVPGNEDYNIRAKAAKKPDRIYVLASTQPWDPIKGRKVGPFVVCDNPELEKMRGFEVELKTQAISERVFQIQIEPR